LQNARCLVKVKFSPKDSRIYEAEVPLFLGGNTAQPYYLVDVRGEGQYPRLKFDTKECIMPPVPLGFTSRAQFYVISQGYDNLQLKVTNAERRAKHFYERTAGLAAHIVSWTVEGFLFV